MLSLQDFAYWSTITFMTPLVIALLPILKIRITERVLHLMLGVSAGILSGVTFADILPEAFSMSEQMALFPMYVPTGIGLGFLVLLVAERYLLHAEEVHGAHFHIHEEPVFDPHHGMMGVSALSFHGFMDGFIIPIGFAAGSNVGIVVTLAVVIHQIPDSFAALSLSLGSAKSRKRAFLYVLITAVDTPIGMLAGLLAAELGSFIIPFGLGLSAGTFIYISAVDLVPELQHKARSPLVVLAMVLGFVFIVTLSLLLPRV